MTEQASRAAARGRKAAPRGTRAKTAPAAGRPLPLLLFLLALAAVPSWLNGISGAYVKRLKTADISLATALPPAANAPLYQAAAPLNEALPRRFAAAEQNRFMTLPARLFAGGAAASLTAEDLGALETAGGSRVLDASRLTRAAPERDTSLSRSRPDPSSLAPQPEGAAAAAPQFDYIIDKPLFSSSAVVVLLHGSGADENSLIPFARSVWPRATLIGLRGRIMQGSERRWYHKLSPTEFDQREVVREAGALAQFMSALAVKNGYAPENMVFVGYSNGANLLAVTAMQYPQLINRAVLLRPMPVLSAMPQNDLRRQRVLTLSGARDTLYGGYAEQLYADLRQNGARAVSYRIPATHMPGSADKAIIRRWLELGY